MTNTARKPIKKRRSKPRRGRVIDKPYLAWLHTLPCAVFSEEDWELCSPSSTAHHVRRHGEPKNDQRAIPLCGKHHFKEWGPDAVEHGKPKFEARFGVSLELLILGYRSRYEQEKAA